MTAVDDRRVRVERPALGAVRCGLVALSTLGLIGAGTELAAHTHSTDHLVPWIALVMLAAATVLLLVPVRRSALWVRIICLLVLGTAAYGVAEHLITGDVWTSLSPLTRSWYGADDLGPSTPLTPGMLGQAALLLLLAAPVRRTRPATV